MPPTDSPEFIALLDRYERPLIRYARSITGDLDSARDVVQETFIKLARGEVRNPEGWRVVLVETATTESES